MPQVKRRAGPGSQCALVPGPGLSKALPAAGPARTKAAGRGGGASSGQAGGERTLVLGTRTTGPSVGVCATSLRVSGWGRGLGLRGLPGGGVPVGHRAAPLRAGAGVRGEGRGRRAAAVSLAPPPPAAAAFNLHPKPGLRLTSPAPEPCTLIGCR